MNFTYLNLFKPIKHAVVFYYRGPNDEKFLFEIQDKEYFYVGEKLVNFETTVNMVESSSNDCSNVVMYPFAHDKENIFLCSIDNISFLKNIKIQHKDMSMFICIKKTMK